MKLLDMRKRMFAGELFLDHCQGLNEERTRAKVLMTELNQLNPNFVDEKNN